MSKPATRLQEVRKQRGLSIRDVAEETGIPRSTVHRIETGGPVPSREHARALYKYFNYEVDLADIYDPLFDFEVSGAER